MRARQTAANSNSNDAGDNDGLSTSSSSSALPPSSSAKHGRTSPDPSASTILPLHKPTLKKKTSSSNSMSNKQDRRRRAAHPMWKMKLRKHMLWYFRLKPTQRCLVVAIFGSGIWMFASSLFAMSGMSGGGYYKKSNKSQRSFAPRWMQCYGQVYPENACRDMTPKPNAPPATRPPHTFRYRHMEISDDAFSNKKKTRHKYPDPFVEGDCVAMHEWQLQSFPTCNAIHEIGMDVGHGVNPGKDGWVLVNNGHYRDVWRMVDEADGNLRALKTIRYQHDYTERNYDRHRRDHLAYERLSSSPYVVDMYSFCANTAIFEYSEGGDLDRALWGGASRPRNVDFSKEIADDDEEWKETGLSKKDRLRMALDVAGGLRDMHDSERDGFAAIAHTDIRLDQFILVDGIYKLNDFNRCRLIRWNVKTDEPCGYTVGKNVGKFRAPEEFAYDLQSEMVDVYSMGNIFYVFLTHRMPFDTTPTDEARQMVMDGKRPALPPKLASTTDPVERVLIEAMNMSFIHDQKKRKSAREVYEVLEKVWMELYEKE